MGISHHFCFQYQLGFCIVQKPSYIGKNNPNINIVYNGIDPSNNSCTQGFSHLDIPTNHPHCLVLQY